ncbi:MAG TPA: chemotaxis protein CheW [Opitutaceae bacterium]|nr:chemotaxis protein CheW [Opitutaceae bacterium]
MNASESYILFELGGSVYALRSADVLHIEMLEHVTPVPNTVPAVDGVVFSRGQVIPALNLRVRFGFPRTPHAASTRLIFVTVHQRTVALVVDAAREFRNIPAAAIRPIEETLHGIPGNYVQGVASIGDRLVLLLDVVAVLNLDDAAPLLAAVEAAAPAAG